MRVCVLISVTDSNYFENCTLVFKSIRVGFPNAQIHVAINEVGKIEDRRRALELAYQVGTQSHYILDNEIHHGDWIRGCVQGCSNEAGPLIICDGDVHFWKSCEDWKFDSLLAGFYMPEIWNPWTDCRSVPRLHTSLLWFSKPRTLLEAMPKPDKWAPVDPFMPRVQYINGEPLFWDTCANLYNIVGGAHFGPEHTACYEHLNSAGFVEIVAEKMGGKTAQDFKLFHSLAPKDMELVRKIGWPMMHHYLKRKSFEAQVTPSRFRDVVVDRMKRNG